MLKHQGLFYFKWFPLGLLLFTALFSACDNTDFTGTELNQEIQDTWKMERAQRMEALRQIISKTEGNGNDYGSAKAHLTLAANHDQFQEYTMADSLYRVALDRALLAEADTIVVQSLTQLGQVYVYQRKLDLADSTLNAALDWATALGDARLIAYAYYAQGLHYDRSSDLRNSIAAYNSALSAFRQLNGSERRNEISCLNYLGIQYAELGLLEQSTEAYLQAAKLALDVNNTAGYVSAVYQSGINLIKSGEYPQAIRLGFQALELIESLEDPAKKARILNNLGDAYSGLYKQTMNQAYYDSAFHYVTQSLVLKNDLGDFKGSAYSLHNLGRLLLTSGSDDAYEYLEKAYKIWEAEKDLPNVAKASLSLGEYHSSNNLRQAGLYYQVADSIGRYLGDLDARVDALNGLADVTLEQNNYRGYIRFIGIRDSILFSAQLMEKRQAIAATEVRLQTQEVSKRNELLTLENEITGKLVKVRTQLAAVIFALLLLSLVLLYVFFKNQQKLKVLNERIQQISKNAFHSQSNGLNLLSSMVRSEIKTSTRAEDQKVLKGVYAKVDALNALSRRLLKANLLDEQSLTQSIELNDYLTDLISETTDSVLAEGVEVEIDIQPVEVSTKVALYLGLVLNEMITNSAKYAVPKGASELEIQLFETEEGLKVIYSDDGPGLPGDFMFGGTNSFGTQMMHKLMVEELKGSLEHDSSDEGLTYIINLSNY